MCVRLHAIWMRLPQQRREREWRKSYLKILAADSFIEICTFIGGIKIFRAPVGGRCWRFPWIYFAVYFSWKEPGRSNQRPLLFCSPFLPCRLHIILIFTFRTLRTLRAKSLSGRSNRSRAIYVGRERHYIRIAEPISRYSEIMTKEYITYHSMQLSLL